MPVESKCLQIQYPNLQTPCFEVAGGTPCEEEICPVFEMVKILKAMDGKKVTSGELRELFHSVCVISMFNTAEDSPYWKRMSQK